jgi:hypothetical protein
MNIKLVSRTEIVNSLLDRMNSGVQLTRSEKSLLNALSK